MSDEQEYFHKQEMEARQRLKAKLEAQRAEADKAAQAELHYLKCGKCGSDMVTTAFRGIEIEICTNCGAVLLDPGELETLAGEDRTPLLRSFFTMFGGHASED